MITDPAVFMLVCRGLLGHPWIFAKTMPQNPHWYTLRRQWNDREFVRVVEVMREFGYLEMYGGRPYTMLDVNEMKYWTMGSPLDETILINRKVKVHQGQYDQIARKYDGLFRSEEDLAENRAVVQMLSDLSGRVLDVGCGTGLLLDYCAPGRYVGLDVSLGMLEVFKQKRPGLGGALVNCGFEDFYDGEKFDVIVSLYGSISYVDPRALARIPLMLAPGGRYFLMFYKPGYRPVTYDRAGVSFTHFDGAGIDLLPGESRVFGNYVVKVGGV